MKKIRAVIIGFSHTHVNEAARYLCEQPESELAAAAPAVNPSHPLGSGSPRRFTEAWNLENVRANYCGRIFPDYREMLDAIRPDIAYILSENAEKPAIVLECARRGIDVCVEKPMAASLSGALEIGETARRFGVELLVNWPVLWRPYILAFKAAAGSGLIGEARLLRYVNGHTGPFGQGIFQRGVSRTDERAAYNEMSDEERAGSWWYDESSGGGAALDISGYGCFFARWLLGGGVTGVLSHGARLGPKLGNVEDNVASIVEYPDKMAVVESTWTTPRAIIPSGPALIGTEGALICVGGAENSPGVEAYDLFGEKKELPQTEFPENYQNMPWHYAGHLLHGGAIDKMLTLDENLEIMALLDAMLRSNASQKSERPAKIQ